MASEKLEGRFFFSFVPCENTIDDVVETKWFQIVSTILYVYETVQDV